MASFNFDLPAISTGTTFLFGSWVCTTNGSGGFDSHLATSMETLQQEQLDGPSSTEFLLPELADEIEKLSLSDTSSIRLELVGVDPIYFEPPQPQLPLGLQNVTASFMTIIRHNTNQKILGQEVTTHQEMPIFAKRCPSLTPTLTRMTSLILNSLVTQI